MPRIFKLVGTPPEAAPDKLERPNKRMVHSLNGQGGLVCPGKPGHQHKKDEDEMELDKKMSIPSVCFSLGTL
ncbi:hypothetical protein PSDVSF_13420 [Pseudodesulfovibrio sediminis]|uniref:Uncharacterized protein n=1 Tax=Pseudodesulfovibrio sediminis TaxID=2810563 RepID=A0ABN6ESC1_9BACT|nr:hypothetical protein PSDVSF_13420 [Pseudodesulfovibrio sediminis]